MVEELIDFGGVFGGDPRAERSHVAIFFVVGESASHSLYTCKVHITYIDVVVTLTLFSTYLSSMIYA